MQPAPNITPSLSTHAVCDSALSRVMAGLLLAVAQTGGLIGRLTWGLVASPVSGKGAVLAASYTGLLVGPSIVSSGHVVDELRRIRCPPRAGRAGVDSSTGSIGNAALIEF